MLYGFPGHLLRLAGTAAGRLRPRLIFTSGELLDAVTRRGIEAGFGAPVFDVYGCTEIKEIAWECPTHEGYHSMPIPCWWRPIPPTHPAGC